MATSTLADAVRRDRPEVGAGYVQITKPPEPTESKSDAICVLTMREAATRLGISTSEMKAMVKRGAVKSVVAGWTVTVVAGEVERVRKTLR
jgi:hypothetical protein